MAERVEVGSVWRHKSGRWPHVRYRVAELGWSPSGFPKVLLDRVDGFSTQREWINEAWLLNKLELDHA